MGHSRRAPETGRKLAYPAASEDNWATSNDDEGALTDLRKVVAVGVACFEQHGVPLRKQPVIETAPTWPPQKDERLSGATNNQLHMMYESLRCEAIGTTREIEIDGEKIALTLNAIDYELSARGDGPIPF